MTTILLPFRRLRAADVAFVRGWLAALALCGGLSEALAQGSTCGPSRAGAVCSGAGVASQGNTSGTAQGAGNPIHLVTGNKYLVEVDLPALPGPLGIEIVRHYNSVHAGSSAAPTSLGRGWRLSYDTQLAAIGRTVQILQADGSRLMFRRGPEDGGHCASDDPAQGHLLPRMAADGEHFDWHWPDGRVLGFDARGFLVQISLPTGDLLVLRRASDGRLLSVVDGHGRELRFGYRPPDPESGFTALAFIDTPVGRFEYEHDDALRPPGLALAHPRPDPARLLSVTLPSSDAPATVRRYHHEDGRFPGLITGRSVSGSNGLGGTMERRIATYAYDPSGRGRLTQQGGDRLELEHERAGLTRVTDERGRVTTARHGIVGGEWRLLELLGQGCAGCGPAPMSFAYDAQGRLVRETAFARDGRPLRSRVTLRDSLGRTEAVAIVEHRPGRPAEPLWVERHRFDGPSHWPVESRYPSVVQGQDRVVRTERNPAGQVVRIRETGFSPLDREGRPLPTGLDGRVASARASEASVLVRETRHVYAQIGGRSRLVMVDGALPNGPAASPGDSDITRLEWDARGAQVVGVVMPGGASSTLGHDAAGRLEVIESAVHGRTRFRLTFDGRPVETLHRSPGAGVETAYRWTYDAAGDLASQTAGLSDSKGFTATLDGRTWRLARDEASSRAWRADGLGRLSYRTTDADGRSTGTSYSNWMTLTESAAAPDGPAEPDVEPAPGRASLAGAPRIRHLHDDFGHRVARLSADHGDTSFGHDEADRLVWMRDAAGRVAHYEHDLSDRLTRQRLPSDADDGPVQTHWQRGERQATVLHPVQEERDRFDNEGRLVERRLRIDRNALTQRSGSKRSADPALVEVHRQWRHDGAGRLLAQRLPDGSWLRIERNGQGQVVGLLRDRLQTAWLSPLLPPQVLASDVQRDLVDLSRLRFGNGMEARWSRSPDGRLVRLVHRSEGLQGLPLPGLPEAGGRPVPRRVGHAPAALTGLADIAGIGSARADGSAPGWLGRESEPQALVDDRFGWDLRGNLVVREERGAQRHRTWRHRYDAADRLIFSRLQDASASAGDRNDLARFHAFDVQGRRVVSQEQGAPDASGASSGPARLTVDESSNRLLAVDGVPTSTDATGRPAVVGRWRLNWSASGQLIAVHPTASQQRGEDASSPALARYGYNHRGERVLRQRRDGPVEVQIHDQRRRFTDLDAEGRVARQWVWLADLPLAVIDVPPGGRQAPSIQQGLIANFWRDVQVLARHAMGKGDRITFLHVNHLGAPVAATDERGRLRWQADYTEYGRATVRSLDGFELDLRLPGQHEDAETGFHHNDHRVYHPDLGRYLTPDPSGTPDGPDPFAYVRHNPLRYVDPTGLVLWAFDGTSNSPDSRTNVWHFAQSYDSLSAYDRGHGISGTSFYVEGPGIERRPDDSIDTSNLDALFAHSVNRRIASQFAAFERYTQANWEWHRARSSNGVVMPLRIDLDVVGFSRGAAMSREFMNRVNDHLQSEAFRNAYGDCLSVIQRLLALFDTVLSFNTAAVGAQPLRMALPPEVQHVFHAVAMNEHRGVFPGESIHSSAAGLGSAPANRVERGFVGAHADIGGGYNGLTADATGGDLSDLALVWMVQMARSAGVQMRELPEHLRSVSSPIVHDERHALIWRAAQVGTVSTDRAVRFRSPADPGPTPAEPAFGSPGDGSRTVRSRPEHRAETPQRDLTWHAGMNSAVAAGFTSPRTRRSWFDTRDAQVDLCRYIAWLNANYASALQPEGLWVAPADCAAPG